MRHPRLSLTDREAIIIFIYILNAIYLHGNVIVPARNYNEVVKNRTHNLQKSYYLYEI